jgi:hypothetical protein
MLAICVLQFVFNNDWPHLLPVAHFKDPASLAIQVPRTRVQQQLARTLLFVIDKLTRPLPRRSFRLTVRRRIIFFFNDYNTE